MFGGRYDGAMEYLATWKTICLPQSHRPSYPSVPQAGVGQLAKVTQGVQHSLRSQEGATFLAADETGNTLNDEARAAGEGDSLNRGLIGEAGNSCRATSKRSRPPCFEGRDGAGRKVFGNGMYREHSRLTSQRLIPLLHLEHGLVKVVVAQRTRPLHLPIQTFSVSHLLLRREHPWMA
jgi:hypothetical protein